MSLRFDATLKDLAQDSPREFLAAFDTPPTRPVAVLNVDLSTVTTAADMVFGLGDPPTEIVHLDFQSGPDPDLHLNVLAFNALLHRRCRLPVHSIVLLLRPRAQHPNLTGAIRYEPRPGHGKMDFGFQVIRLWEQPVESLLAGALGTLPLAPLCRLPAGVPVEEALAGVVRQVVERLRAEASPEYAKKLLTAAFVLAGLRVERNVALKLFQGVRGMHDSSTYEYILDEGRAEGLIKGSLRILVRMGRKRFGEPDAATQAALQAIADPDRLERMGERLLEASGWEDLLQTP